MYMYMDRGAAAPLTQKSRLSAYSRHRRHLTASSRAIPSGAGPPCSSEPGTPWRHAHCKHTTRSPETLQRGLALIREEPLLRNCVCSVRKTRIPDSALSGVLIQQLGFIRQELQETSTTGGFLLCLSPAGMMECVALTFPNQSSLTYQENAAV